MGVSIYSMVNNQGAGNKLSAWERFADQAKAVFGEINITREQALSKGLKFYYTGKTCKNGHDTHRWSHNRQCRLCLKSHKFKEENAIQLEEGKARRKLEERLEMLSIDKEWGY